MWLTRSVLAPKHRYPVETAEREEAWEGLHGRPLDVLGRVAVSPGERALEQRVDAA